MDMIDSITQPTTEEWRDVPGYKGLYQVSNLGRVYSKPRATTSGGILKPHRNKAGYLSATLTSGGINRRWTLHELVALAFIGRRPAGLVINHLNGDKEDNRPSNLEYCTNSENVRHAFRSGLVDKKGEKHHNAKLTEKDVWYIRMVQSHCFDEVGLVGLAYMFGVSTGTISDVLSCKSWRHVEVYP